MTKLVYFLSEDGCPEAVVGDWKVVVNGLEAVNELKEAYQEEFGHCATLYDFLGLELHSQQQGQSKLFYKGLRVHTKLIEDTCGNVSIETLLDVAGVTMPLGLLASDDVITI